MGAMKRAYRLRRPDQFQRVRRDGRGVVHQWLALNVAPNQRRQTRVGFVVSKRVGSAVVRNRCRRRVREVVRLAFFHIRVGYDIVIVIRTAEVASVPFSALQSAIESLLRRSQLWRDEAPSADAPPSLALIPSVEAPSPPSQ